MLAPIQKSNYQLYKTTAGTRKVAANRSLSLSETQKAHSEMSLRPRPALVRQHQALAMDSSLSKSSGSLMKSVSEAWRTRKSFRKKRIRADTYTAGPTFQPSKNGGVEIDVPRPPPISISPEIHRRSHWRRKSNPSFVEGAIQIPARPPPKSILKSSLRDSTSSPRRSLLDEILDDTEIRRLSEPDLSNMANGSLLPIVGSSIDLGDTQSFTCEKTSDEELKKDSSASKSGSDVLPVLVVTDCKPEICSTAQPKVLSVAAESSSAASAALPEANLKSHIDDNAILKTMNSNDINSNSKNCVKQMPAAQRYRSQSSGDPKDVEIGQKRASVPLEKSKLTYQQAHKDHLSTGANLAVPGTSRLSKIMQRLRNSFSSTS